jgi:hypothetical protein
MKRIFTFVFCSALLASCSSPTSNDKNSEVSSAIEADDASEADLKKELSDIDREELELQKAEAATKTSMSFDKMKIDFGKIKEDSENAATFIVTNTGKNPLIIERVDASCGCTTAKKPEKPILPGKSDKIEVVFHPKVGQLDTQEKTVTVTANTDPSIVVLKINAFVVKK